MRELAAGSNTTRIFLLLFLSLNFLFLLASSGRVRTRDELAVDLQAESLATRGSTATPQAPKFFFYGKIDRAGQPQPPYGAAHAVLVLPWYEAGRILRGAPGVSAPAKDVVMDASVVASSATFAALAVGLMFLILARLGISKGNSILAACAVGLATPLFSYATWLYSEPLAALLLLAAAWVLFAGGNASPLSPGLVSVKQAAWGGVLLGVALWVRPAHLIAAPVFLAALVVRDRERGLRAALVMGAVVGLFGAAYLVRNVYFFGSPFDFGYPTVSDGGKNLNSFHTPLWTGLYGLLLSPGKSILLFAPPIVLAIVGIRKLVRMDRGLAVVAGVMPVVYLLFYARYTQWEGGFCVGPRYLIPTIPLLCLGLGPFLEGAGARGRRLLVALCAVGLAVQTITSATSYLEDQANGTYYDLKYNYRMDYAPMVTMSKQLAHYVTASQGARLGLGFDRWFVFLAKAGVARGTVLAVLTIELAGLVFFAASLWKTLRTKPPLSAN
jgi:hypothetical protein